MPVIDKLKDNLQIQVKIYSELNKLADVKKEALISNKLNQLEAVIVREEQLLINAARVEKERLLWAEQVGKLMSKAPEDLTLSELAERFPVLQDIKEDLSQVIENLKEKHELNAHLLNQALKLVDFTVGVMTFQEGNTYQRPGQKETELRFQVPRILDKSI